MTGCAASKPAPSVRPPDDLTIDLVIVSGFDKAQQEQAPAHERTGRFVVLPGGDLLASTAPGEDPAEFPPFRRTLTLAEVEALWRVAQENDLTASSTTALVGNLDTVETYLGEIRYNLAIRADGERHAHIFGGGNSAVRNLARSLAALSWMSDDPPSARVLAPRRYDFGPDPYAPYRSTDQGPPNDSD